MAVLTRDYLRLLKRELSSEELLNEFISAESRGEPEVVSDLVRVILDRSTSCGGLHRKGGSGSGPQINRLVPDPRERREQDRFSIWPLDPCARDEVPISLRVGGVVLSSNYFMQRMRLSLTEKVKPESDGSFILMPDKNGQKIYYLTSLEEINLPPNLEMTLDAKSTTGRIGAMCHPVESYFGFDKRTWFAVQPYAFPIRVTPEKDALVHALIRFARSNYVTLPELMEKGDGFMKLTRGGQEVPPEERFGRIGAKMTYSTKKVFRARPFNECMEPIDLGARGEVDPEDYFELIEGNSSVVLDATKFYLFGTRETISLGNVLGRLDREAHDSGSGFWHHFAGYFNPGFKGSITLECWSSNNRVIEEGHPAGEVLFDELVGEQDVFYAGSYQDQSAPELPKMFKPFS